MTNKTNPTILIKPKIIKIIPKCELNASLPGKFNALKSIRAAAIAIPTDTATLIIKL